MINELFPKIDSIEQLLTKANYKLIEMIANNVEQITFLMWGVKIMGLIGVQGMSLELKKILYIGGEINQKFNEISSLYLENWSAI